MADGEPVEGETEVWFGGEHFEVACALHHPPEEGAGGFVHYEAEHPDGKTGFQPDCPDCHDAYIHILAHADRRGLDMSENARKELRGARLEGLVV